MDWKTLEEFYRGKRVLVTGHTGFKGSWLCRILALAGAQVTGYSLKPPTSPSLFETAGIEKAVYSVIGDVRDLAYLRKVFEEVRPQIAIHLAAQPIVRDSYKDPVYTYETNVMGTVHVLECIRQTDCVRSFLNVTTDKVYENREWEYGYRETDPLDGYDPYSNSKSCSELVTHSYQKSFLGRPLRHLHRPAGNVIGGGDFANDRIIPDCVRAVKEGQPIGVRNPFPLALISWCWSPWGLPEILRASGRIHLQGYYNVGRKTGLHHHRAAGGFFARLGRGKVGEPFWVGPTRLIFKAGLFHIKRLRLEAEQVSGRR